MSHAGLFVAACEAELQALKPGNVHVFAGGHGMTVEDFRRSALAAAPAIADPALGVGARILAAVEATRAAVGQNTNLGIVLLSAPLLRAADRTGPLARELRRVLHGLDVEDARAAFAAIRLASPGGLGGAAEADVRDEPRIGLLEAMRLAEARDRVAWNYVHGMADLLRRGAPRLATLRARGWPEPWPTSGLYMDLLATIPDSHVARKHGPDAAEALCRRARPLAAALLGASDPSSLARDLLALDAALKAEGLNPGTTADLTVASHLALSLLREV
ncbi:MAG TPA: triphosphoribosyl-dephospho-CoA synthase [Geminicoccaceae bacterium]|nr:triphosphoribosyl-dephospho-CoA synthase [Geminicoccus sp.]HMU49528.1 triphosphoribosyl-dephospho-CoA synthase [Geminicoccaceae bacterium]